MLEQQVPVYSLLVAHAMDHLIAKSNASASRAAQLACQLWTISDVQRWLATLTEQVSANQIKAAVDKLKRERPRQEDVRPLCSTWSVMQQLKRKDRSLAEIISNLRKIVIGTSNRLKVSLAHPPPVATYSALQSAYLSDVGPSATEVAELIHTQNTAELNILLIRTPPQCQCLKLPGQQQDHEN